MLRRLLRAITSHWGAKLLALLGAFGLWAFVVNSGFRQEVLPQPLVVEARGIAPNLAISGVLPSVQIEVRAPTAVFQAIKPEELHAFVDVTGASVGSHPVAVQVLADDPNVQVIAVTPPLVEVALEKRVTKSFTVELETEGDLGQGFVADETTLSPERVEASGAASVIADVDKVVVRLSLSGETSQVQRSLQPQALDGGRNALPSLSFDPADVAVTLKVARAEDAKEVGVEVETTGSPAAGFFVGAITVEPSTVTAQGSSKVLDKLTTLKTMPVDLADVTETVERTVEIDTPDNVRAEPSTVKVKVEIKAGRISRDVNVTPEVVNLEGGQGATVSPDSVVVTLTGPADLVGQAAGDLRLRIDASGRGPGDFTVPLLESLLNLPSGVSASFSVGSVTVRIT